MQLGYLQLTANGKYTSDAIRDISAEEIVQHKNYMHVFHEAREKLFLLKILEKNYDFWNSYIEELLVCDKNQNEELVALELNRNLLNYLTSAYTIKEHFESLFKKKFRGRKESLSSYDEFVDTLCKSSWPTAFIWDFRNYVQHVELGITGYYLNKEKSIRSINIYADAKRLAERSKQWDKSKLNTGHEKINLIKTIDSFHNHFKISYLYFLVNKLFPELTDVSVFYKKLTNEVTIKHPHARMIFITDIKTKQSAPLEGEIEFSYLNVPNNVFEELGLKMNHVK